LRISFISLVAGLGISFGISFIISLRFSLGTSSGINLIHFKEGLGIQQMIETIKWEHYVDKMVDIIADELFPSFALDVDNYYGFIWEGSLLFLEKFRSLIYKEMWNEEGRN
jgi:hypothetical protein